MGLNRKSAKKLASLSALGAGALALTADNAEASIITSSQTLFVGCGCSAPWQPFVYNTLSNADRAVLINFFVTSASSYNANVSRYFRGVKGAGFAFLKANSSIAPMVFQVEDGNLPNSYAPPRFLKLFPAGAQWNTAGDIRADSSWPYPSPGLAVAHRRVSYIYNSTNSTTQTNTGSLFPGSLDPANKYLLFSFSDNLCAGGACYGWINLGIELTPDGPNVTIRSWAYDDSGAMILAGQGDPVPEPSTFAMAGLAALALGAKGIRRWRAARPS